MNLPTWPTKIRLKAGAGIIVALCVCTSCSTPEQPQVVKTEKAFASGGNAELTLDGGNYTIRSAASDTIRVSFSGNAGNATADLTANGTQAKLVVKDTPHNFQSTIEVPATTDLVLHLAAGNLEIAPITGSKDIESKAGNVQIAVGNADDYLSVDASVGVGNLDGGPFGDSGSGPSHHLTWAGHGKYTLRLSLGAGNLELHAK